MIILDGAWWCGKNKQRGIGRYLDAFFRYEFQVSSDSYVWIFPEWSSVQERTECTRLYGGQARVVPIHSDSGTLHQWWLQLVTEFAPTEIWLTSPFERPWSLLRLGTSLFEPEIPVKAVIFDLLPLQYPRTILHQWPVEDQQIYSESTKLLQNVDAFFAISPHVRHQLISLLQIDAAKIQVLEFGLQYDWIEVPRQTLLAKNAMSARPKVVSISGGEWRKNIRGTLRYFSQALPADHHLFVICELSWSERLRYMWMAFELGILHRVTFTGYLSEEEKWHLLLHADVGVFLSFAEGLGIPLLEYARAAIPRIVISEQLERDGFGTLLPPYYEVALEDERVL